MRFFPCFFRQRKSMIYSLYLHCRLQEVGPMKKLFLLCACLLLSVPCQAQIFTVDDDGPADFNNIQDAINYSWHGDTVLVKPGSYNENIYFSGFIIIP